MNLEGRTTRLRALEPGDIDLMYAWENDTAVWSVSGTLAPFSRHTLERFIQEQQFDMSFAPDRPGLMARRIMYRKAMAEQVGDAGA